MIMSFFRRSALWTIDELTMLLKLQSEVSPRITDVQLERRFMVDTTRQLNHLELGQLGWLLSETNEQHLFGTQPLINGKVIEVGPRLNIVTPDSTNAVSICRAGNLGMIPRLEQSRRILISVEGEPLTAEEQAKATALIYDRMTEQPYTSEVTTFDTGVVPGPDPVIDVLGRGVSAILEANSKYGLAVTHEMAEYICSYYKRIGRNPTLCELFMFGQLNSEHCRHHLFKGLFIVDGKPMEKSLFQLIRATTEANPGNVLSAYEDNAAAIRGFDVSAFMPSNPLVASAFTLRKIHYAIIFKAETHNHPTAISPYPGAATGAGGEIRDENGTGIGGLSLAGFAGFFVANMRIPGYIQPWEMTEYAPHPRRLATPLQIAIEAPNGAFDYGNQFGRPVIFGTFTSFEQMVGDDHYGWKKTCMVSGGAGLIDAQHVQKKQLEKSDLIVQIGGDRYWIGLGGGSGSSKDAGGQGADLDFDSVQRANGEMENRTNEVIRACSEMGDENPIVNITDLGAGGECVALPEIVFGVGAKYELRQIPCGDSTMPVYVFWCNESQESMVMGIKREKWELFKQLCDRNRCPVFVVGEVTGDNRLVLTDKNAPADAPQEQRVPIDVDMNFLLADLPRMEIRCETKQRDLKPPQLPEGLTVRQALERVLRLAKVGLKTFLTHKVDRSVTGLVARQQTVGRLQLPLADCAVSATGFFGTVGTALAEGDQPIKSLVNNPAGVRMSVGEGLTNLVWAPVKGIESVNWSATWQWPCKNPGEDARLYEAVRAASELCIRLGMRIPVGKDSVSMTAWTEKGGKKHAIKSPGNVQMIAFAPCPDITKVVTPDIKRPGESVLMFLDLSGGKYRLGGSSLLQAYEQVGDEAPDVDDPLLLKQGFEAIQELLGRELILAGHDRSDGGLMVCLLEMAFAGNCGFHVTVPGSQSDHIARLFADELGAVIEILPENQEKVLEVLRKHGLDGCFCMIGGTTQRKQCVVDCGGYRALDEQMVALRDVWSETSFQLDRLHMNPKCADDERRNSYDREGLLFKLGFEPEPTLLAKLSASHKPRIAILREEGINGHREMAGAFWLAGFEPWDVAMTDIAEGRVSLSMFRGVAASGGFSFKDVLDAGKGWAGVIKFNDRIREEFERFFARPDTFSLGVCNGCQMMQFLDLMPWQGISDADHPRFVRNESTSFESRFVAVQILESPSIFLKGMEGSTLGVWVAHGEGRGKWPNREIHDTVIVRGLAPVRFVDDKMQVTEQYPFNPNGSEEGITALCSADGRHLAMMPHPERLFLRWQWPYWPSEWSKLTVSPWLRMFQNARVWCEQT
jgi:phosphoribosylformylglycinamidine synthase